MRSRWMPLVVAVHCGAFLIAWFASETIVSGQRPPKQLGLRAPKASKRALARGNEVTSRSVEPQLVEVTPPPALSQEQLLVPIDSDLEPATLSSAYAPVSFSTSR